jgi:hypothetical protein
MSAARQGICSSASIGVLLVDCLELAGVPDETRQDGRVKVTRVQDPFEQLNISFLVVDYKYDLHPVRNCCIHGIPLPFAIQLHILE